MDQQKVKDQLSVTKGEVLYVLLLAHDKLPDGKYLAEKEDGTSKCMYTPRRKKARNLVPIKIQTESKYSNIICFSYGTSKWPVCIR